jgi:hypothetical protein
MTTSIPINILPDDVLLEIFNFCVDDQWAKEWQSLVHVCRRWRSVVFGSRNRLKLRLVCTAETPVRDTLDVWPPFPLLIRDSPFPKEGLDNIIAVFEHIDRVRVIESIKLTGIPGSHLEKLSAAMQVPFPELTYLELKSYGEVVLPDSFLGGSTPRLQSLHLYCIPFPGLPKLLLSATHLVDLNVSRIPHSGYISPEVMGTVLLTLTCLDSLRLEFQSPRSLPDRATRPPPPTRSVLSIFRYLQFKGDSEYLDDLLAHIDAPRLNKLYINFFNQIAFDTSQLIQFICRTPKLKALERARIIFGGRAATLKLSSLAFNFDFLRVAISCRELDWQVSSLEQVCTSCLPPLATLKDLYIHEGTSLRAHWQDNIENPLWLELLHPFRAVKNLYLSEEFELRIGPALRELGGGSVTEVLPALQRIFLVGFWRSDLVHENVRQFIAEREARREVTGLPTVISTWYSVLDRTMFQEVDS